MMTKIYYYLKQYPITVLVFILYLICWVSLFDTGIPLLRPIIIGEWPIAPVNTMPFCMIILLNALFMKGHRWFYLITAFIVILPFLILGLLA